MKKIITFLLSIIMVIALLTSSTSALTTKAPTPGKQVQANLTTAYPLKVKDATGYTVTIKKKPVKIIPLSLGSSEILFSVVDLKRITAISNFADDANVSNINVQAKMIKKRASTANTENIIALGPDLVLLDSWTDSKFVKQLRDAKITVYIFKTPSSIDEDKAIVKDLAHMVGEDSKGTEIINWMDTKLKAIENKLKALKPGKKLTVLDYSEMGSTSGKGTNFDDVVTRAGLINLASKNGLEGWPQISKEVIIKYDPDILSIPGWFYDPANNEKNFVDKIIKDKSLAGVKAVKNRKIIAITYKHIASVSQYAVLGVEDTAKAAYPELFK
jgi:iron complex transport system substrate-binding protein